MNPLQPAPITYLEAEKLAVRLRRLINGGAVLIYQDGGFKRLVQRLYGNGAVITLECAPDRSWDEMFFDPARACGKLNVDEFRQHWSERLLLFASSQEPLWGDAPALTATCTLATSIADQLNHMRAGGMALVLDGRWLINGIEPSPDGTRLLINGDSPDWVFFDPAKHSEMSAEQFKQHWWSRIKFFKETSPNA